MDRLKNWFKYNKIFWKLKYIHRSKLGSYDIDREEFTTRFIRHIITGKCVQFDGWNHLTQAAIYKVNGEYKLFENQSLKDEKKKNF